MVAAGEGSTSTGGVLGGGSLGAATASVGVISIVGAGTEGSVDGTADETGVAAPAVAEALPVIFSDVHPANNNASRTINHQLLLLITLIASALTHFTLFSHARAAFRPNLSGY